MIKREGKHDEKSKDVENDERVFNAGVGFFNVFYTGGI
jgi:hypothetical protein